ncbi:MAG: S1 family peptidase, partial [Archangium sp.]
MSSPLDAAAAVVLLEFKNSYGLGFVAPNGRIVTCFHVVADEGEILAHLGDGRSLPVRTVCALDLRRDLVVLDVGLLDATPVRPGSDKLVEEGVEVFTYGMVSGERRVKWTEAHIDSVQVFGSSLSVYGMRGDVPPDASGAPVVDSNGVMIGVAALQQGDEGALVLPWRYVEPLLRQNRELPLSTLSSERRRPPKRDVPDHPISLLNGSAVSGLEVTTDSIADAIRVGAPAYNQGDIARCYTVYAEVAQRLIATRDDCPGVQVALRAGLARAAKMEELDLRAWAMRDAFDGLLLVIEKYLRSTGTPPRRGSKTNFLN